MSHDTTARLWDAESGQPLGTPLDGHEGVVTTVAFSPAGKRLASAVGDKTVLAILANIKCLAHSMRLRFPLAGHD